MNLLPARLLTALCLLALGVGRAAGQDAAAVAKQRQAAEEHCRALRVSNVAGQETAHLLVFGTVPDAKLKSIAGALEKQYATALKALQFDKGEEPWPGKLTMYIFTDRADYRSFVRQVEKRSPDEAEQGSGRGSGDVPHVAAGPGRGREAPTPEAEAGYQLAAALLAARAKAVPLPDWVVSGFGRATAAQAAATPAGARKRDARNLARRFRPIDVWGESTPADVRQILATSVADFVFFGKVIAKPADFLAGFRPDDERPMKTAVDALAAVKLTPEQFELAYRRWLQTNN